MIVSRTIPRTQYACFNIDSRDRKQSATPQLCTLLSPVVFRALMGDNQCMSDLRIKPFGDLGDEQRSAESMVERVILVTFGVLRAGVVIQMLVSGVTLIIQDQMPLGSLVMLVVAVGWSIGLFAALIRRGSFAQAPLWWGVVDLGVAAASLIVTSLVLPKDWLVGTWHAWQYGYVSVIVPTIAAWMWSRAKSMIFGVGIAVIYVATVLPGNESIAVTVVVNSLALITFAVVTTILLPAAREIARTSDLNKERGIQLAIQLEQAKYKFHIHNVTGLLVQLAHDDTPPQILPALRTQAIQEANRLRHDVLMSPENNTSDEIRTLGDVVSASVVGFGQLPIEVRTALARDMPLTSEEALVVQSALISLLYNVQFHAQASEVVVHADCVGDIWEVSVCDDGIGFDPRTTPYGFGLQSQVLDSAQRMGMTVEITSAPGEGTCVVIRGHRHEYGEVK